VGGVDGLIMGEGGPEENDSRKARGVSAKIFPKGDVVDKGGACIV
jgi:hypothetical protein